MALNWGDWAKTAITEQATWSGTLTLENIDDNPVGAATGPPSGIIRRVQLSAMGVAVVIVEYGSGTMMGPPADWPQAAKDAVNDWIDWVTNNPPEGEDPPPPAQYTWFCYHVYISAPGPVIDESWEVTGFAYSMWYGPFSSLTRDFSLYCKNVGLRARGGIYEYSHRQTRDIIDTVARHHWFADDTTVSGGTFGALSAEGTWTGGPGVGELPDDWPTTFQASYQIQYGSTGSAQLDTNYGSIAVEWDGQDVKLNALDDRYYDSAWHHWWDGDEFQDPWPPSGKTVYWRCYGDGNTIRLHKTAATTNDITWTGWSRVPKIVAFNIEAGKWDDPDGDFDNPIQFDLFGLKDPLTGDRIYLGAGQSDYYTEAHHAWFEEDVFGAGLQTVRIKQEWYEDPDNGVNSSAEDKLVDTYDVSLDDRVCGIAIWDLTQDDYTQTPYVSAAGILDISHDSVNVHLPPGLSAPPTQWQGSGGLVVTNQTNTTVTFEIPSTATEPKLYRELTSRYWVQMDRLQPPNYDDTLAYKTDWPIYLKANLDNSDVPATDPLYAALTADEDVTNYSNHSYLRLKYNAPRDSDLTVQLTYRRLIAVVDPCYTCWEYRYGPEGAFWYARGEQETATYSYDYQGNTLSGAGNQDYYIDLRVPAEGGLVRGALSHVEKIEISGFSVPASGTDTWTLDVQNMTLCDGPSADPGPKWKFKRPWRWTKNWTAGHALHCGADIVPIQYGYEQFEINEQYSLKHTQFRQHCPTYSGTPSDLSYAKTLRRLAEELNFQEGISASFTDSGYDALFKDGDGNYLFAPGNAYWWWLKYDPDVDAPLEMACTVGAFQMAPGVVYNFHIRKFLDGKAHGLVTDGIKRLTNQVEAVAVYKRSVDYGGEWSLTDPNVILVGKYDTDADGRWVSDPLEPEGWHYAMWTAAEGFENLYDPVHREYFLHPPTGRGAMEPTLCEGPVGNLFLVYEWSGYIWLRRRNSVSQPWSDPIPVCQARGPAVLKAGTGVLWLAVYDGTTVEVWKSEKDGDANTWEQVT